MQRMILRKLRNVSRFVQLIAIRENYDVKQR